MEQILKSLDQAGSCHSRIVLSGNLWVVDPYLIVPTPWMPD